MVDFLSKNYMFWYILKGLGMENVGIFYDRLVYFYRVGMFYLKIWQPRFKLPKLSNHFQLWEGL
jgi:hypothetical protein